MQSELNIWVSGSVPREEVGLEAMHPCAGRLGRARMLSVARRIKASMAKNGSLVPGVYLTSISQEKIIAENQISQ